MNQTLLNPHETECQQGLLSSALAITMSAGLAFLIAFIINHLFPSTSPSDLSEFTEYATSLIHPEPTERRTFQLMVLLAPVIALLSHAIVKSFSTSLFSSSVFVKSGYLFFSILAVIWVNSWTFWPNYMLSSGLGSFSIVFPVITGVLLLAYVYIDNPTLQHVDALIKKRFTIVLFIVSGICLLISTSFRIFDWKFILFKSADSSVLHHFNPVLYYASQAESGNYSTSIGAPQYGFYSLYLKPVFSLLGLTVYSFSLVMTLLYLLGVIAITVPIFRHLQNIYLKLLLIPVLCALQGSLGQISTGWEPYFQYYPIRFIVPGLSILMLYLILRTEQENARVCLAAFSSFLFGFLVFWNLDSGITTVIAWFVFFLLLAAVETLKRHAYNPALHLFLTVATMLPLGVGSATIILFSCDKSGIYFERLFEMQKIFYLNGFGMLPMPLSLHPWMAVLGVYLATLVMILPIILRTGLQSSHKHMLTLYIAIIGIGLFTYYQGRSHDRNLPTVVWPAILCCFLACDWCLSMNSAKRQSAIRFLTLPFMVLTISLTIKLVWSFPWYLDRMILSHRVSTAVESNSRITCISFAIDWLSEYRNEPLGSVLVIHPAESVFYAESGLHPLPLLPSNQERIFFNWQEVEMQNLIRAATVRHLFISPYLHTAPKYKRLSETIRSFYELEESFFLEHWTLKKQLPK